MRTRRWHRLMLAILAGWCASGAVGTNESYGATPAAATGIELPSDGFTVALAKQNKKKKKAKRQTTVEALGQAPAVATATPPPGLTPTRASNTVTPAPEPARQAPVTQTDRPSESAAERAIAAPAASAPGDPFLVPVASGLSSPILVTHANDNSDRLFVVEQAGVIKIVQGGQVLATPFLNVQNLINSSSGEQGLLGLAFHPNYASSGTGSGQFFIFYTASASPPDPVNPLRNIVARYTVSSNPNIANTSGSVLLSIEDFAGNHNGGMLAFGPDDGYLYIATGDGGGGGDPQGNGQKTSTLLGKILRIDVNNTDPGLPYAIPPTNPTLTPNPVGSTPRREIWSLGLRNPWRFSFDRSNGDMYIGDVGQGTYEEIDFQPSSSSGGENYGWNIMEGAHCYPPSSTSCNQAGLTLPILEYQHTAGACSVTGGYVYRGPKYPSLAGSYFYSDFCNGIIWRAQRSGAQWTSSTFLNSGLNVSSFGEDQAGELYVVGLGGSIFRLADPTCSPRPNVQVSAMAGSPGQLLATVTAGTSTGTPDNQLLSIQFTQTDNAVVDIGGQSGRAGSFSVTLPAGAQQTTFVVRRPTAGQASTVHFVANDVCGPWPSFVGGGAGAF